MKKLVFNTAIIGLIVVGLIIADTLYHMSFTGSFGMAQAKVSRWWNDKATELPATKEKVLQWADTHGFRYRYSHDSQTELFIYLDRVSETELGIVCYGWDIIARINFNAAGNVNIDGIWAQSDCIFD